jgi:hypothetical protein
LTLISNEATDDFKEGIGLDLGVERDVRGRRSTTGSATIAMSGVEAEAGVSVQLPTADEVANFEPNLSWDRESGVCRFEVLPGIVLSGSFKVCAQAANEAGIENPVLHEVAPETA